MSAKIIQFFRVEGPMTQRDTIAAAAKRRFAQAYQRHMPDDLAYLLADRAIAAPRQRGEQSVSEQRT